MVPTVAAGRVLIAPLNGVDSRQWDSGVRRGWLRCASSGAPEESSGVEVYAAWTRDRICRSLLSRNELMMSLRTGRNGTFGGALADTHKLGFLQEKGLTGSILIVIIGDSDSVSGCTRRPINGIRSSGRWFWKNSGR